MDDFEKELKIDFLNEGQDLIDKSEQAFLILDKEGVNPHLLDEIFRLAHNLKGTSRAVGFAPIAELTHVAENLILKLKQQEVQATRQVISLLLQFNDAVRVMIEGFKNDLEATFDNHELQEQLESAVNGTLPEAAVDIIELSGQNINEQAWADVDATAGFLNIELPQEVVESAPVEKIAPPKAPISASPKEEASAKVSKTSSEDETIRVSLQKIDHLNNFVGEMVILQTVLQQRRNIHINDDISNKSIHQLSKISKEIQSLSMSLRMIPIKSTFQKLTRIVRDVSNALKKEIDLVIEGENTEVDKTIVEKISDPLVHIVRNAVDHGIESEIQDRLDLGKLPKGKITIRAYHEAGLLAIEVLDDGKGLDPKKLITKAKEKGLIGENQNLDDQAAMNLIFHPGFSTKDQVTEVSGRGVGMDVVKTNIESLGGEVKISSQVGKGSTFKINLPLTLAIIDGMVIKQAHQRFIVPLSQVQEFVRLTNESVFSPSGVGKFLKLRGDVIPLVDLAPLVSGDVVEKNAMALIFHRGNGKKAGVIVENITNQQQVVVKPIGKELAYFKSAMGSSILGDGKPAFIIDLNEVFNQLAPLQLTTHHKKQLSA
jgi:two-component system, chemotaxis family, sensor kinase CheA